MWAWGTKACVLKISPECFSTLLTSVALSFSKSPLGINPDTITELFDTITELLSFSNVSAKSIISLVMLQAAQELFSSLVPQWKMIVLGFFFMVWQTELFMQSTVAPENDVTYTILSLLSAFFILNPRIFYTIVYSFQVSLG